MSDADLDGAARDVRDGYDAAADRYARHIAPSFAPIAERLVALAAPRPSELHLDLGTGTGVALAVADRHSGMSRPPGRRVGLDLSAAMLLRARAACPTAGLVQGDLERLPLAAAAIDVATLSLALHHLPRPSAALAEAHRVLRPGGRLAVAAWSDALSPLWRAFDAWSMRVGLERTPPAPPADVAVNTPGRLGDALAAAGFASIDVRVEHPPLAFDDLAAFWEWRISFPATHRALSRLPADERERHRAGCLATLGAVAGTGPVRADLGVLFALAR